MFSFNLVDQPWIPCRLLDGPVENLGLRDTLRRAHEIEQVTAPSPLATVAIHRLLLAVLHRALDGPRDAAAWHAIHEAGRFDAEALDAYLGQWRARFDLFDAEYPFFQAASLSDALARPVSALLHEGGTDGSTAHFNHPADVVPGSLSPPRAAQQLVAHQAFALGGLITHEPGESPSAPAAPLVTAVVFLTQGESLFETLLRNLHRYDPEHGAPFEAAGPDPPAWERDSGTTSEVRLSGGYLDLLTWQSRRIRLLPSRDPVGDLVVRQVVLLRGESFPSGYVLDGRETMVAYRQARKAREGDPFRPLRFQEGRALWRDSLLFLQASDLTHTRPRMLEWLAELGDAVYGVVPLHAIGLASTQKKAEFWRHERLSLPTRYFQDATLIEALRYALELAENVGVLLGSGFVRREGAGKTQVEPAPLRVLAKELQGTNAQPAALSNHLNGERSYWAALDAPFRDLLHQLPGGGPDYTSGEAFRAWVETVERAARRAFDHATDGLRGSARTLRAAALAEDEFERHLQRMLGRYRPTRKGVPA